jgi:hypothetical protein
MLPPELLVQIQSFIEENRQMGFTTKEEFIRDAIRFRLTSLKGDYEFMEIPKDQFDMFDEAVKEMNTPYRGAVEFISAQMKETLEKYQEWKKTSKRR